MAKYSRAWLWVTAVAGISGGAYWLYGIATGENSPLELIGGGIALAILAAGFRSGRAQRNASRARASNAAGEEVPVADR